MKTYQFVLLIVLILAATSTVEAAQKSRRTPESNSGNASLARGQRLVDQFVAGHPELAALELALTSGQGCKTVAASAREDVGEACDADELGPMMTGKAEIEEPTDEDPVYDITQALHDAKGNLIGAAGMDLKPTIGSRDQVVVRAKELLQELEAQIPSKSWITEAISR